MLCIRRQGCRLFFCVYRIPRPVLRVGRVEDGVDDGLCELCAAGRRRLDALHVVARIGAVQHLEERVGDHLGAWWGVEQNMPSVDGGGGFLHGLLQAGAFGAVWEQPERLAASPGGLTRFGFQGGPTVFPTTSGVPSMRMVEVASSKTRLIAACSRPGAQS